RLLALNKLDLVEPKHRLLPLMKTAVDEWGFAEAIPVSARTGEGCELLLERLLAVLPVGPPLYPDDFLTDQSERVLAAEAVREQLLAELREELPHATAVVIEGWEPRPDGGTAIDALILVDKETQKPIVIGRAGDVLKRVGTTARQEISALFGRPIVLKLWVQVRPQWRDDPRTLQELGLE
ncbi:MAG TPA: GTPase Era, partial [Candidatus Polarisedimenticolaceae bacterium]|nr:GTPase Era [Candidatus Polarisedimenticolaceae bacterium]